ncbi:MAG: DUF1796 family putative cysteine peptidase [Candidatus Gastranaerophilales bacterium]|nr:DUF1796 family putative cysteine peptidase [Candidatus Gastranaerophilales bacterium]
MSQNEVKTYDLIFSIGQACSCTENLRLYKLQNFSYPFDWLYGSNFNGRIEIVKSKFKDFINKEDLTYRHPVKSIFCDAYENKSNGLVFNHDFPAGVELDKSYDEIKAKYDRRIARLLKQIEESQKVLLVYISLPSQKDLPSKYDLIKAQEDVQNTFPNTQCDILYVEHNEKLPLNKFKYEQVSPNVLKISLFNRSLEEGANNYDVHMANLIKVFMNYHLTGQINTSEEMEKDRMRRKILAKYCDDNLTPPNKFVKKINRLKIWFRIARGYTIPQSVIPYIFAVIFAAKQCHINYFLSFLGLIGVALVHMSVNMLDDYFDWKKGAVAEYKKLVDAGIQTATHKCFYLEQNLTTPKKLFNVAIAMDAVACLIGLFISYKVGISLIIIAFLTGLMGFFYSAPPIRLSYRGLGEIAIGIIFGPLLMAGAYITAGATLDKPILFASLSLGLLIANIAHTHAIMDFKSDEKVGKTSLATFFKTRDNAIVVQALIYIAAYLILALGIILKIFPLAYAITFITIPKAYALIKLMKTEEKQKKLWMGVIENWKQLQEEGSDWFMLRLCLSRNILIDFILILGVTYYLFG